MRLFVSLCALLFLAPAAWGQTSMTWQDNSNNESGFNVERAPSATGAFAWIATLGVNVQAYTDAAGQIGQCYRVQAFNAAGTSGYSNTACKTAPSVPPDVTLAITCSQVNVPDPPPNQIIAQINFQPTAAPVPAGYTIDDGSLYAAARGFGWDRSRIGDTRDRNINSDQRLDTLMQVYAGQTATWNYDLPNGNYLVTFAVGDAQYAQGPHVVDIEGVNVLNISTAVNQFNTVTDKLVTVNDGKLTVKLTGPSSVSTTLNYLVIKRP